MIDTDFEAIGRDDLVDLLVKKYGRENISNIITFGTLQPKSLTKSFFRVTEGSDEVRADILTKIPKALYGVEPSLKETVEGNPEKNYEPHLELKTNPKYRDWYNFASKLEDMVCNFGVHAAGIVLSDFPISDVVPTMKSSKADMITQWSMKEVEEAGLIKFDFLVINNLDIIKECIRLIKVRHNIDIDMYKINDGDKGAYALFELGIIQGIFQMETSKMTKELLMDVKPTCLEELSDITSLCRPGAMQYIPNYVDNKKQGSKPSGIPDVIANITKTTQYILIYQEQFMKLCQDVAGYTLLETDNIRRALGKKQVEVLKPYKESFIAGMMNHGLTHAFSEDYWEHTLIPFANYSFNKSHSICYSYISYVCAWLKANYSIEFFTALMTIRAKVMQPKHWAQKAPEYINEAKMMNIKIHPPSINDSDSQFTINKDIYFGLSGIRSVGVNACKAIMEARKKGPFKSIWDFLQRVKVTSQVVKALVLAGAFDCLNYSRKELKEKLPEILAYFPDLLEANERIAKSKEVEIENARIDTTRAELAEIQTRMKAAIKQNKKDGTPIPCEFDYFIDMKLTASLAEVNAEAKAIYEKYGNLRKRPEVKLKEIPPEPTLVRKCDTLDVEQLFEQFEYIGCYLGTHPSRLITDTEPLATLEEGRRKAGGQVVEFKQIKTKKGQDMAFMSISDGTATYEVVVFPETFSRLKALKALPEQSDIIIVKGIVTDEEACKMKADQIQIVRSYKSQ